jgi:hypothetical protein
LPNLHAKRGLGDVQLLRGARHIAGLDHADEVFDLTQVHGEDLSPMGDLSVEIMPAMGRLRQAPQSSWTAFSSSLRPIDNNDDK